MWAIKDKNIYDFYYAYQDKKCTYTCFRKRVLNGLPMEEAISSIPLPKKLSPAREFYDAYQWPKPMLFTFLARINNYGISFGEAIDPNGRPTIYRWKVVKVPHLNKCVKKDESKTSFIDVTLKPEESSIFRRAYSRMLSELESDLEFCEIPSDVPIITAKIKQLKEEIRVFDLYN